ncbi:MAG TPA: hypothetical protein PLL67_05240 [Gammaproteobacteria bacterium]|nr:hypothetical protein [Gammaproteobacteria bacterium]
MGADLSTELGAKLLEAVNKNSLEEVQRLLRKREVDPAYDNNAALRAAAKNDQIKILNELLKIPVVYANAAANDNEALRSAAEHNHHTTVVRRLLQIPVVSKNAHANNNEALAWMIFHSKDDGNGPDYFDEVYSLLFRVEEVQKHAADNQNELLKLAITNGHLPITQQLLKIRAVCEHAADNENELVELARRSEGYKGEHNSIVKQLKISAKQHAADTKKDTQEAKTLIFSDTTNKPESLPNASEPMKPPAIPSHPKTH